MKAKAIIRMIACTLTFFFLLSILSGGLLIHGFFKGPSGELTTNEKRIDSYEYSKLEIEWVAGKVTIQRGGSLDAFIISETKDLNNPCSMDVEIDDDTIRITYGNSKISFDSLSGKDLLINVPALWNCDQLSINGVALDIDINAMDISRIELDGVANSFSFNGALDSFDIDGVGMEVDMNVSNAPKRIIAEGVGNSLDLTLPVGVGYDAHIEGAGVSFDSSADYNKNGNNYTFGNKQCSIDVSGVGCSINVDPS